MRVPASMLAWRHSGFSVHNGVRVRAGDIEGRKKLARYMLRAPLSLEKMTYDAKTGMVIYRSHMHPGLKRNFQLMPGAQGLRGRSSGMSQVRRADAGHRADRRRRSHSQNPRTSGLLGAAAGATESACAAGGREETKIT